MSYCLVCLDVVACSANDLATDISTIKVCTLLTAQHIDITSKPIHYCTTISKVEIHIAYRTAISKVKLP